MATAPVRSGLAEINSSHRLLGSPVSYNVEPWPTILGWMSNWYSSIRFSRSSSVASLPLPRSTPSGGRVFELLYRRAQVVGDVVAVGPWEVLSLRGHHVLQLGLQLDRPLAHRRRCLPVVAGHRWPVVLHHLVGDTAPQYRPAFVHEAGEDGVCLLVGDSFLEVDSAVKGDVDTEGQESHDDRRRGCL